MKWAAPAALAIVTAAPGYAAQYLTVEQAQKLAFPEGARFAAGPVMFTAAQIAAIEAKAGVKVQTRGQQVWKVSHNGTPLGWFVVDYVIGKHLVIDYAVALTPEGAVKQVEILEYRESYGGEVHNPDWLTQFAGKTAAAPLQLNDDIRNISGATLSSRHVAEGVKRVLAMYEVCLKQP